MFLRCTILVCHYLCWVSSFFVLIKIIFRLHFKQISECW